MEVEKLKQQHLESYKMAVLELIQNNTKTLIQEDITSLLREPPLDSMDLVKNKLLHYSKQASVVLDIDQLNPLVSNYRKKLVQSFQNIGEERISKLGKRVQEFHPLKENEVIKIPKKEFTLFNKQLKKEAKEKIHFCNQFLLDQIFTLFKEGTSENSKKKIAEQMNKYLSGTYTKDLLDSIEMKLIIKDTTLMNSILEQGERYLFTKSNSHLFDEEAQDE